MLRQQNGHAVKKRRITNVKVVSIEKRKDTKNLVSQNHSLIIRNDI